MFNYEAGISYTNSMTAAKMFNLTKYAYTVSNISGIHYNREVYCSSYIDFITLLNRWNTLGDNQWIYTIDALNNNK